MTKPYKPQAYQRALTLPLDTVLNIIRDEECGKVDFGGYLVNTKSLRLQNFGKSIVCSCCGLKATHFAVESNSGRIPSWHLNMWASVGSDQPEVLFTHDHTKARSLGGTDDQKNTTTMCAPCNNAKSVGEREQLRLKRLTEGNQ